MGARDQLQARLRTGLISSVTREEESIVVCQPASLSQEGKCLSPRSLSKSVKFQFKSPDSAAPSPGSHRKISILKNHQSVCDTQECEAPTHTVIPESATLLDSSSSSSTLVTRKDISSFYDFSNQGFTVV